MPSALASLPETDIFTQYYYHAYTTLRGSWQSAMGAEPVPLSEITNYCAFLDDDDPPTFVEIMIRADAVYLEHVRKKETK